MIRKHLKRGVRLSKYIIYRETLVDHKEHFWAFVGAFIGIGVIAYFQSNMFPDNDNLFLIGSFGASSVLVFGVIQSPLAQPRNLIGGHVISALVGVTIYQFLPNVIWITAPLAVAQSIVLMQVTKTLHPPGGATALIAVIGSEKVKALGYWFVLTPVLSGCLVLLVAALIFNNITSNRQYPTNRHYTTWIRRIMRKRE
jgi:CBS domain-containing membrane protein